MADDRQCVLSPSELGTDLKGVDILLVEDVWHVAKALQNLLRVLGANVVGPASTIAEAERLISEQLPHVALVDFNLRGELATSLIDRLNDRGIPVVVTTGYADVPLSRPRLLRSFANPYARCNFSPR